MRQQHPNLQQRVAGHAGRQNRNGMRRLALKFFGLLEFMVQTEALLRPCAKAAVASLTNLVISLTVFIKMILAVLS
jgi:ectoine hydroxylase-related dioxygenase (phytanoyl-CoA dioxygenase family)